MSSPELLLDVTRLVWRTWRGQLPTGIDRVCSAYMDYYGHRARAVVQRRGLRVVFSDRASQKLFSILCNPEGSARQKLLTFFVRHVVTGRSGAIPPAALYINVGHTGLDDASLVRWIASHRLRAIYLIHDLIPITHPEFCRPGERDRHKRRMRNALASASGIIGNSQATMDELGAYARQQHLKLPSVLTAWIAGNPVTKPASSPTPGKPYFVTLGTIEARKNHSLLLDVWERLLARLGAGCPQLFVVGNRGWEAEDVFRRLDNLGQLRPYVTELGEYPDDKLAALISGATALLMPSKVEGYGLPVFEALEVGTPVIATDLPVYREVAGDIPTYRTAEDSEGWEEAILSFLARDAEQQRQSSLLPTFNPPTWEEHFERVDRWISSSDIRTHSMTDVSLA